MSRRDKLVIVGIAALAVLAFGWLEVVSPERKKVSSANSKVEAAKQQLDSAQTELSTARSAQARYGEAYASIVRLGKAVPAQQEVPSLVYEVDQASNNRKVEFTSITTGSSASGSAPSSSSTATPGAAPTTFAQMPFTFIFNGSFADLYHLMSSLQQFDIYSPVDGVTVNGRLLSIQSINLAPETTQGIGENKQQTGAPGEHLTGTITATAYVLPPTQSLTAGATPSGPAGTPSGSGGSTAGSSSSSSSPATIKALP
jgi:hypothetical protein